MGDYELIAYQIREQDGIHKYVNVGTCSMCGQCCINDKCLIHIPRGISECTLRYKEI